MEYFIERRTMTRWHKNKGYLEPCHPWNIERDPKDVLEKGFFEGPFVKRELNNVSE